MSEVGFEPTNQYEQEFKPCAFNHSATPTFLFLFYLNWWNRQDLNLWSLGYEPSALTNYATVP